MLARLPLALAFGIGDHVLRAVTPSPVSSTDLARLFPTYSRSSVTKLQREVRRRMERTRLTHIYLRGPRRSAMRPLVQLSGLEHLPAGPAVLLGLHLGPWHSVAPALRWAGHETLAISANRRRESAAVVRRKGGLEHRADVAQRAAAHLRAGGRVLIAADGRIGESGAPASVLGRRPLVRPGAAALARLAGVPMLPVTARWEGREIHVRLHAPLVVPDAPDRHGYLVHAAAAIGGWIDHYVRAHPADLTPSHVAWLLESW